MEWLTNAGGWLVSNIETVLSIVGFFALVATKTPNKADDKIVQLVLDGVNFLAGNVGKSKNDPAK